MQYSLAVTAFEEVSKRRGCGEHLLECIAPAQDHPAIEEIVIVDDGSEDFDVLKVILDGEAKVRLHHNANNLGVFGNKLEAIAQCRTDWVITCDSDNTMHKRYIGTMLDVIEIADSVDSKQTEATWFCASYAKPRFDYRELVGTYDIDNIGEIINHKAFPCFFNTGNQTVNRDQFMQVFGRYRQKRADLMLPNYLNVPEEEKTTHYWRMVFDALDSFILNMQWLLHGGRIRIVEHLEYDHRFATGDSGNYTRSPQEKSRLGETLLALLKERVNGASQT